MTRMSASRNSKRVLKLRNQALRRLGMPSDQIYQFTDEVRQKFYLPLYDMEDD